MLSRKTKLVNFQIRKKHTEKTNIIKKTAIGESMAVSRSQTQHGMDRYDCAGIRMFEMGCLKQGVLYSLIRQNFDGL